jgi:hypothetical protein
MSVDAPRKYEELNLDLVRGGSYDLPFTFQNADGESIDISTWVFECRAKRSAADSTDVFNIPDADIPKTQDGTAVDTITVSLTDAHTDISARDYEWVVEATIGTEDWPFVVGTMSIRVKA